MSPDRPTPDLLLDTARTLDNLLTVLLLEADAAAIQAAKRVQELRFYLSLVLVAWIRNRT